VSFLAWYSFPEESLLGDRSGKGERTTNGSGQSGSEEIATKGYETGLDDIGVLILMSSSRVGIIAKKSPGNREAMETSVRGLSPTVSPFAETGSTKIKKLKKRKILDGKKRARNSHVMSTNYHKSTIKKPPICTRIFGNPS
jgi:hypothetical protein